MTNHPTTLMHTSIMARKKNPMAKCFSLAPFAALIFIAGCGGGDGAGSNNGGPTVAAEDNEIRSATAAGIANTYYVSFVQPGESPTGSFSVDSAGKITNCTFLPVCTGVATPDAAGENIGVRIEANDGKSTIDNKVTIQGSVDNKGNTYGTYAGTVTSRSLSYAGSFSGSTTAPSALTRMAALAGTYVMTAEDGTTGTFDFSSSGDVIRCDVGGVVKCAGTLIFNTTDTNASFRISGNDGLSPVDTTADLSGSIDQDGNIIGSYVFQSESDGSGGGRLAGRRVLGVSTTLAPPADLAFQPPPAATSLTCTAPKVPYGNACVTPKPKLTFDYAELNFETVPVGETSMPQTVTLRNSGNVGVSLNNLTTTLGFGGGWKIINHSCGDLAVLLPIGETCKITVVFQPTYDHTLPSPLIINNHLPSRTPRQKLTGQLLAESTAFSTSPGVKLNGTAKYPGIDARQCIQIGIDRSQNVQTIKNICDGPIGIRWCHGENPARGTAGGVCGNRGQYFQYETTLEAGAVKSNPYTTPVGSEVVVAACVGTEADVLGPNTGRETYRCDGI